MITRRVYKKITWINLESPTASEIEGVAKEFDLHPIIAKELLEPSLRSKVEVYKKVIYSILHFPLFRHKDREREFWELDCILGKTFLITSHIEPIAAMHEFERIVESSMERVSADGPTHAGFLFYSLITHLQKITNEHLVEITEDLGVIEEGIFSNREREMVTYLATINHDVLDIKRGLHSHKTLLRSLVSAASDLFGESFAPYMNSLASEHEKIWENLEGLKEHLTDLRNTNDSLLSAKTNEVMKLLTMMTALMLPATIISAILTIPTASTPFIGGSNDFLYIIFGMAVITAIMVYIFRRKRWL